MSCSVVNDFVRLGCGKLMHDHCPGEEDQLNGDRDLAELGEIFRSIFFLRGLLNRQKIFRIYLYIINNIQFC